jgi:hypothetical protein
MSPYIEIQKGRDLGVKSAKVSSVEGAYYILLYLKYLFHLDTLALLSDIIFDTRSGR